MLSTIYQNGSIISKMGHKNVADQQDSSATDSLASEHKEMLEGWVFEMLKQHLQRHSLN